MFPGGGVRGFEAWVWQGFLWQHGVSKVVDEVSQVMASIFCLIFKPI